MTKNENAMLRRAADRRPDRLDPGNLLRGRVMQPIRYLLVSTLLLVMATAAASQPVGEFSGRQSSVTAEFTVEAPWILDWRLNGDYEQMIALDVQLLNARTGIMVGRVLHTKRRGNGVKLFNEGGTYKFRVSSTLANWTLRVEQLTEEEAELYTPKQRSLVN